MLFSNESSLLIFGRKSARQLVVALNNPVKQRVLVGLLGLLSYSPTAHAQYGPRPTYPTTFDSVYTRRPARMVYFIAWEYYGGGQVEWTTLGEKKATKFEVQQSNDGHQWQPIGTMDAHPGTKEQQNYTLYDSDLKRYGSPIVYYRVRLVAQNGHSTLSPVRSIRLHNPDLPWRTAAGTTAPAKH